MRLTWVCVSGSLYSTLSALLRSTEGWDVFWHWQHHKCPSLSFPEPVSPASSCPQSLAHPLLWPYFFLSCGRRSGQKKLKTHRAPPSRSNAEFSNAVSLNAFLFLEGTLWCSVNVLSQCIWEACFIQLELMLMKI